jgi:hypothetical protein
MELVHMPVEQQRDEWGFQFVAHPEAAPAEPHVGLDEVDSCGQRFFNARPPVPVRVRNAQDRGFDDAPPPRANIAFDIGPVKRLRFSQTLPTQTAAPRLSILLPFLHGPADRVRHHR